MGIIASTIVNHSFCPPKKAMSPGDFMPSQWEKVKAEREKPKRVNRKLIAQQTRNLFMAIMNAQKLRKENQ